MMHHMKFGMRNTVRFVCFCLFFASAVIASLNEETAILLLIVSTGMFILMGLLGNLTREDFHSLYRKR